MKNVFNKMRRMIGVAGDFEEYDDEYYEDDDRDYDEHYISPAERYEEKKKAALNHQGKVVPMPSPVEQTEMKVVVISPSSVEDARAVCDYLKAWAPVIVKLDEITSEEMAQKTMHFIWGACYTLDGHVQEIKDDVFLVAPSMVKIEKDSIDMKSVKSASFISKFYNK